MAVFGFSPHAHSAGVLAEGAWMAFARAKAYWVDMKASIVASRHSDESRVPAKHFFEEVLPGARVIEAQCSKDVVFE